MSYAPGKWEVRKGTLSIYTSYRGSRKPLCHKIANTKQPLLTKECQEANAKLMAAAPELLAALQSLVELLADDESHMLPEEHVMIGNAREAIAKATGGLS